MNRALIGVGICLAALISACAPALAGPPHLIASWPAAGAALSPGRHILELTFNRALDSEATWASMWGEDGSTLNTRTEIDPSNARRLKLHLDQTAPGTYDLHWHAVDVDSHLASDGDQWLTLQDETPAPPRLDVSPEVAGNGERLELVGKGFAADAPVQLTMADSSVPLATTRTDSRGKLNVEVRPPASVPYGVQPITATDADGRSATTSVLLRYGGWPPVTADNVAQSGPLPGEVTFTVTVRNLSDYVLEHVAVTVPDPEGAQFVSADGQARHAPTGVSWLISEMDRGTAGPFHLTYRVRGPVVGHVWVEFRHRHERGCAAADCIPAFISNSEADSAPVAPAS